MTPEERDLLLSRYATGRLSESELRQLREAALADQSLFDAMAEEEELRDLLGDPASRQEVLEALEPPGSLSLSSWRGPWAWATAGGLAAVAVLTVAVWRMQQQHTEMAMQRRADVPAAAAPAPQPVATPPAEASSKPAPPPTEAPAKPVQAARAKPVEPPAAVATEQVAKLAAPEAVELKKSADEAARPTEVMVTAQPPAPAVAAQKVNAAVGAQAGPAGWSVRWYVEGADGSRKPIKPDAEVDRGATVLAEVRSAEGGAVQITPALDMRKEERDAGEAVAPGQIRIFRWRLDQPGTQQLTVSWRPRAVGGGTSSPRATARDAAVAPSGFNEPSPRSAQISLRVR